MATEFPLDFKVLAHLRGYPEDLRRYSNLLKQTHPRGVSAVDFLLKRPGSGDFVEAVCRLVRDGEEIVSAVEAGELLSVPPKTFLEDLAARPRFPAPLYRQDRRAVWRRADVEAYRAGQDG